MSSPVGLFTNQLIRFFEDLKESFPEERDIKSALEMIKFAKASNPKLVLDMFHEHIYSQTKILLVLKLKFIIHKSSEFLSFK